MTDFVTEHVMGTVFSVDCRDELDAQPGIGEFMALMHAVDEQFSPFRPDSEVSRIADGRLQRDQASDAMRDVLELCEAVRVRSGGNFDVDYGRFDPSGLVKGWAVDEGVELLRALGWRNFCINAGGDVFAGGRPEANRAWQIGIRHPLQGDQVAAVVSLCDQALATSGAYERGEHIVDPATGVSPRELLSFSVTGPRLALADAYATAGFVMGRRAPEWIAGIAGYEGFAATADQRAISTEGFAA